MTDYNRIAVLVCTNKDVGNALANLAASFPSDPGAELGTFVDERMLSPTAWYAAMVCKESFADVVTALKEGAAYSDPRLAYLIERGLTMEQWNTAGVIFPYVEVYVRSEVEGTDFVSQFVSSVGYTIVEPTDD